ncbi:MAG TPA: FecR domain-containing protein [Puia sp.]|nr:FecR domain-containing protein [Puia sp.]
MHSEERYKKLLDSYLAGTCTPEERRIVEEWFEKGGDTGKPDLQLSSTERLLLLDRIHQRMETPTADRPAVVRRLPYRWLAAAVCIGVLVTVGLANLTRWRPVKTVAPIAFITIQTGRGQVKKITLPDQSTVWINANSILSYHPDFINHRQLLLSGEALFDVTQDKLHTFSVLTGDSVNTEVLGTVFNISAHAGSGETDIAVLSGKVQVSKPGRGTGAAGNQSGARPAILTQQQAIRYDATRGSFARTSEIPTETAAWTKGEWVYNDMRIRDLALLLNDQYGVTVRNQHNKGGGLQTGMNVNFNRSQTAEEIVNIFCALAGSRYRKVNNTTFEIY